MNEPKFKKDDKVYWNAGWNDNLHHENMADYWDHPENAKSYGWMLRGPYDFGYYSATPGNVILYKEGERSMQDSFCVDEDYVISEKEYNQIKKK